MDLGRRSEMMYQLAIQQGSRVFRLALRSCLNNQLGDLMNIFILWLDSLFNYKVEGCNAHCKLLQTNMRICIFREMPIQVCVICVLSQEP
jgi:sulfur relay (sulfurtransferase) complex TusBCD TusD component (DsrE family)